MEVTANNGELSNTQTPLADIFNDSSYAFQKFRQAEDHFESTKKDLRKSRSEFSAFPALNERALTKHESAKSVYNKAADESRVASQALDGFLLNLGKLATTRGAVQSDGNISAAVTSMVEERCRSIVEERISDLRQQDLESRQNIESQISTLKYEMEKKDQEIKSLIEKLEESQQAEIVKTQEHSNAITNLNRLIEKVENTVVTLQTNIDQLKLQRTEETPKSEDISVVGERVEKVDERTMEHHNALERAQKAFTMIYKRLEIIESDSGSGKTPEFEALVKPLENRLDHLESQVSGLTNLTSEQQRSQNDYRTNFDNLQNHVQERLSSELEPIRSAHANAILELQKNSDRVTNTEAAIDSLALQVNALETSRAGSNTAGTSDADPHAREALLQRVALLERITQHISDQISGFAMVAETLSRKFDELSTDEIVTKINMSLRNGSSKDIRSLTSQLQNNSRNLERLDVFDRRLTAIEQNFFQRPRQDVTNSESAE
ncbi:hypothetical protein ABW19_dt0209712 [Dactylella cylindrospora]|nr:hypothetical protein ABW19_dt0209712 [Dactylella cylindrospora]